MTTPFKKFKNALADMFNGALEFIGDSTLNTIHFVAKHKKFFIPLGISLAVAAAVALGLFLSPVTLAIAASFPVYGFSVASLVGTNVLAQIGAITGLAFAAAFSITSLAGYALAYAYSPSPAKASRTDVNNDSFNLLSSGEPKASVSEKPQHFPNPLNSQKVTPASSNEANVPSDTKALEIA